MSTANQRDTELQSLVQKPTDKIGVRGFARLQIEEDGIGVVGDSGWIENQITQAGFRNLSRLFGGLSGSSAATHLSLGSGGAPATNATTLAGEVVVRAAATAATSGSTSVQFTATFSSANSFVTNTQNISNIGVFQSSATGTLFGGQTYASSSCATNQNVNATYTWTFA